MAATGLPYRNAVAVLSTMHGKERAIGPTLEQGLGLRVALAMGLDTDRFGTFSRDVERTGSQLDAARAKIAAGFDYAPYALVGLASEGSFGPHPYIPFLVLGRELVLLIDRERGLEVAGHFASPETNYAHTVVSDMEAAAAFAERSKFPEHGLIVMGCIHEEPAPGLALFKDVVDHTALEKAVGQVVAKCGAAFIEADMRADRNPTRMRAIERAASGQNLTFESRRSHLAVENPNVRFTPRSQRGESTHCGPSESPLTVRASNRWGRMDIHKPKPFHGWREFLKEIATIVIGVLLALGAEQVAVALRDRHAAAEAREAVDAEIRINLSYMQGRMVAQACVERRLDEIGALLVKAGEGPLAPRPNWIGQPSSWLIAAQRWQAATGSGRVSLFDGAEQGRLAGVYSPLSRFADAQESEQAAWAQLRGLETWTGPLGAAGRIHFLSALQQARYELWNTRVAMEVAFRRAQALGITKETPRTMEAGYKLPHAVCLPIDTPRDKAVSQLAVDSPPWGQPK